MEWLPLLYQILEVCVIPLLGILTAYFVKWVNAKSTEITFFIIITSLSVISIHHFGQKVNR